MDISRLDCTHRLKRFAFVLLCFLPFSLSADDWARFRGPNGSGVMESATPPTVLGPDENVRRKTPAPAGLSSPIVSEGQVFLTGQVDQSLVTVAYDLRGGRELWRCAVEVDALENVHAFSSPASSTPCADGERVYSYFNSFGMVAYDFDGKEVWRIPLEVHKVQYGAGSSPVMIGGDLIVQREGGAADSHVLALDPKTGETRWTISRPLSQGSHSTPMLWDEELIIHGRGSVAAYDLETKEISWWVNGWKSVAIATAVAGDGMLYIGSTGYGDPSSPLPKELDWTYLTATYDKDKDGSLAFAEVPDNARWRIRPAVPEDTPGNTMKIRSHLKYGDADKNEIVTAEEWAADVAMSHSIEFRDRFVAIRPGGRGNVTETHVAWESTKGLNEMPSPIYYRGYVFDVADGGRLTAHETQTGERVVNNEPFRASGQYVGSPIAANGHIYLSSERGTVSVVRYTDELEVIANNKIGEKVRSTPAIAGDTLIVRTEDNLWAFAE